jgi:uncharacterized protein YbjT (DUF2867 family)
MQDREREDVMKVLVIGATGQTGRHAVKQLRKCVAIGY